MRKNDTLIEFLAGDETDAIGSVLSTSGFGGIVWEGRGRERE